MIKILFQFIGKIFKAIWRFGQREISISIFLAGVNAVLFIFLLYTNLGIVAYIGEIDSRTELYDIAIQDQVINLFKTVTALTDLSIRTDITQLNLLTTLAIQFEQMAELQKQTQDRLKEVKTIDLKNVDNIKKANLVMYNISAGVMGSGTHIRFGNKDFILTCAHLIKDPKDMFIAEENENKENMFIDLVNFDRSVDLALFRIKKVTKHIPALEISHEFPKVGSEVIVIGNPGTMEDVVTDGTIAKIDKNVYITTNKIFAGNSGGAVLYKGKIVGVVSASKIYFNFPHIQRYSIAVNLKSIHRFLEDCNF